jgi:cell wall-associated NlpC family hydrolase
VKIGIVVAALLGALLLLLIAIFGGGSASADTPPGGCSVTSPPTGGGGPGQVPQKNATLTGAQMAIARIIIATGKGRNIAERGTAIALMTAMQESTLNPNAVNGRSVGLYQQQGSLYAGIDRTDPAQATNAFYSMLVLRVPNYADATVDMAQAAQTVQASGAGAKYYAQWENWASALASQLFSGAPGTGGGTVTPGGGGVSCTPGGGSGPIQVQISGLTITLPASAQDPVAGQGVIAPNAKAATAIAAALSWLGETYTWGGGNANGPTPGQPGDPHDPDFTKPGFDCSGLTLYAYAQAGITLPHNSGAQLASANGTVPFAQAVPGDLVFYGSPVHHVAIFLGDINGAPYLVQAPESGVPVDVAKVSTGGDFRGIATAPWQS